MLIFLLFVLCEKNVSGIGVELDVTFADSTLHPCVLYALSSPLEGVVDTLAIFDSLSFSGLQPVSLFFDISRKQEIQLKLVGTNYLIVQSKLFQVSPRKTIYAVSIDAEQINLSHRDFLYLKKKDSYNSYFFFLLIFFVVKTIIAAIYIAIERLPKRLILFLSGIFLLTAFIDWFVPLDYMIRFFIIALAEFFLIALTGRKFISWKQISLLIITVNIVGFGLIFAIYSGYIFW